MAYQRTSSTPEEAKAIPHAELSMLREIASQDYTHLRSEPETPSENEDASGSENDGSSKVVSTTHVLIRRITAHSVEQIEKVIADLQELRAFLDNEGERVQQEIASYLRLSQTAIGSTKIIADSIPRRKIAGATGC
jgi:hypothetical protein